ncbi:MAG: DNA-binding protein Alba [Candidatus Bathyarchaeia archaeon]
MSEKEGTPEERPTNCIYIGKKPLMSYALAILLQFNAGHDEVIIKARGRSISQAVDVAEIVRRRLYADKVDVNDVRIGTEVIGEDMRNVSTIEIVLGMKK